ncbi:unnamed protein product [Prorocentrum cordatum]|uniref:Uncharacterized protein n=1 Tax=Prorocentrum cordatum TaxID=2364126 RepID=A0ABN9Y8U5_9DINO|nr:unnamed protein product [Polarella glacialis]
MISSDSLSPSRNRSAGPSTISFLTESRSRFRWGPSASTPPARSRPGRPCTECRRAPRRGPGQRQLGGLTARGGEPGPPVAAPVCGCWRPAPGRNGGTPARKAVQPVGSQHCSSTRASPSVSCNIAVGVASA